MAVAARVIPCLDLDQGRVVKGVRFADIRDAGDPVEAARRYDSEGADELVILDITASKEERKTTIETVRAIAGQTFIPLTVGGGVSSPADVDALLRAGADKVSINTAALSQPDLLRTCAERFGSQCIVLAIDARRRDLNRPEAGWEVYTHGGRRPTSVDAVKWAKHAVDHGVGEILLTSMDRDGTRAGFDIELTRAVCQATSVPVIASGGVGSLQHLAEGVLHGGASGVLAASIFHFGEFSIAEAKAVLLASGIETRE